MIIWRIYARPEADVGQGYTVVLFGMGSLGVKMGGGAKLPSAENILVLVSVLEEPIHGVIHKTQLWHPKIVC